MQSFAPDTALLRVAEEKIEPGQVTIDVALAAVFVQVRSILAGAVELTTRLAGAVGGKLLPPPAGMA